MSTGSSERLPRTTCMYISNADKTDNHSETDWMRKEYFIDIAQHVMNPNLSFSHKNLAPVVDMTEENWYILPYSYDMELTFLIPFLLKPTTINSVDLSIFTALGVLNNLSLINNKYLSVQEILFCLAINF